MEPLVREITDFSSLQVYVQSSDGNLFELTRRYYYNLGKKLGFEPKKDIEIEQHGVQLPRAQLAWFDAGKPIAAFFFCFGSREELLAAIFSLLALNADLSVLITSSKARNYSLEEIKNLLQECQFLNIASQFLLVDISKEEFLVV